MKSLLMCMAIVLFLDSCSEQANANGDMYIGTWVSYPGDHLYIAKSSGFYSVSNDPAHKNSKSYFCTFKQGCFLNGRKPIACADENFHIIFAGAHYWRTHSEPPKLGHQGPEWRP